MLPSFPFGGQLGVLGDILAFNFNLEEHNRGSPHYHGVLWLKYKPDAQTFRRLLEQPAFQQRILQFLGEIIKHEAPAQWKNPDPHSLGMLQETQQELKQIDCPHRSTKHVIIIQRSQAKSSMLNADQHLSYKRIKRMGNYVDQLAALFYVTNYTTKQNKKLLNMFALIEAAVAR